MVPCIWGTPSTGLLFHPDQLSRFGETFRGKTFGAKDRWTCPSVTQAGRHRSIKKMNAFASRLSSWTHANCTKAHISLIKFLIFPITHIRRALVLLTLALSERDWNPLRNAVPTEVPCLPVPNASPPPNPKQPRAVDAPHIPAVETHTHHMGWGRGTWQVPVASGGSRSFPKSNISVFTHIHRKGDKPNAQENLPLKDIKNPTLQAFANYWGF